MDNIFEKERKETSKEIRDKIDELMSLIDCAEHRGMFSYEDRLELKGLLGEFKRGFLEKKWKRIRSREAGL